jgi:opacity protein-like surface antigen
MRKILTAGVAALTFGGAVAAAAIPTTAAARGWHGGYHGGYHHHRGNGAAIFAGVAGLALGAALADNGRHYYRGGYGYGYAPGYYDYDDYGYRTCESRHWTWDPYIGRRVLVTTHYAC